MQRPVSRRCPARIASVLLFVWVLAACGQATPTAPSPVGTIGAGSLIAGAAATSPANPTATPTLAATPLPPRPAPATPGTPGTIASVPATPAAPASATAVPPTPVPRAGLPVRVRIPRIKVDAAVEHVGLAADGAMDVPKDYGNTAWYQLGPRPGEPGNAAIAGHVDSRTGPAVFWNLTKLRPGDEVLVAGADGVERRFVVLEIRSYQRADAPLDRIFGPATASRLNLITCDPTSTFNRATSEYAANIVVYTEFAP